MPLLVTEAPADVISVTSSDEEETMSNVKLSRILMHDPKENYTPQRIPDEESKKVIVQVFVDEEVAYYCN